MFVCPDSKESLQLTMTEVLKRQCSKSKKGYNQVRDVLLFYMLETIRISYTFPVLNTLFSHLFLWQHISISEVKVDKVQIIGGSDGTTFAVCLDQDKKKFIQSVTR